MFGNQYVPLSKTNPMQQKKLNRRRFLRDSSLGFLGAGLIGRKSFASSSINQDDDIPKIREYRTLGRTGFKVSDIGTGYPFSEAVLKAVLKSGINFIETSEMYDRGQNERLIGTVIKDFERDKLFIATKVAPKVKEFQSAEDIVERANSSLARLQTDYIDCFMIHGAEKSERVKNPFFHKAAEQLKKEGKIRFTGLSCHGHAWWDNPEETFEEVLMTAIDDGQYDVLMLPYNFIEPEMGNRVLKACKENNIGTMIMKSNPIIIYDIFKEEKENAEKEGNELPERYKIGYEKFKMQMEIASEFFGEYGISGIEKVKDGALQFVLSNDHVNTICYLFQSLHDVEKYIKLSGTRLEPGIEAMLNNFKSKFSPLTCRIGCNVCEAYCPNHLPINTIIRYNYYFTSKRQEKHAMQKYRELSRNKPDVCYDCEGFCEKACPYGVLTRPLLAMAHRNLSLEGELYT